MSQSAKNILFILFISLFIGLQMFVAFNARRPLSLDPRSRATDIEATPSATPTSSPNTVPTCDTLAASPSGGTGAPLTVTFTCTGHDPDGYINGAIFDFGDRTSETVEKNVGSPGSITITHTYREVGALGASCKVKDNNVVTSPQSEGCKSIVRIAVPQPTATPTPVATPTPIQTLAPTPTPENEPTLEPTETPIVEPTQQSSGFPWWLVGVVGGTLAIVGGFFLLRRKNPPTGGAPYPSSPPPYQPASPTGGPQPPVNAPPQQSYGEQPPSWPQNS